MLIARKSLSYLLIAPRMMMSHDNDQRITKAREGDRQALKELLADVGDRVWKRINNDIAQRWHASLDADDVMQVSYMEAFLRISHCRAETADGFAGWLTQIANNNLRDAIRELSRKKRPNPAMRIQSPNHGESCVTLIERIGHSVASPSRQVAADEAATAIDDILKRMPPDYAKVIRLYDLQGRDIRSIADELGRSSGAVHMLRARAHDRLRELLGAETNFFTNVR